MGHVLEIIYMVDLADIRKVFKSRKTKKSFIVNCGYGKGHSVKEVVEIFKSIKKCCCIF